MENEEDCKDEEKVIARFNVSGDVESEELAEEEPYEPTLEGDIGALPWEYKEIDLELATSFLGLREGIETASGISKRKTIKLELLDE